MKLTWRTEWPHWLLLLGMLVLAAASWTGAPQRIPIHWNAAGEVDGYGGKFMGLLFLPLVAIGVYLLLAFLPRLDPGRANYAQFAGAYAVIRLAILAFMAAIYAVTHAVMRGHAVAMNVVLGLSMGALLVVLGNVLGKVRPNWFVGVRTPWTLSSKLSWSKTHRLAGWLFVGCGLALLAVTAIEPAWLVWAILAFVLPASLVPVVYSYFVWRSDPEKVPPAGTLPAE